jgi:DNA repair protein RadA/Sms
VRASAFELIRYAKDNGVALVLVGHVTKDGTIAGPRVLEHMVDVVMSFEGERSHQYRILRALKNRFGAVDEIGVFAMDGQGLVEVPNPSMLFLSGRDEPIAGSAVFPALEGTRPVLVEIQALIVRLQSGATPRRAVVGWDSGRLAMLLAVLEARCGLNFSSAEVYLNVAGGYRLADPAADLALRRRWSRRWPTSRCRCARFGSARSRLRARCGRSRTRRCVCARRPNSVSIAAAGPGDGARDVAGMHYFALATLPNLVDRIMASP